MRQPILTATFLMAAMSWLTMASLTAAEAPKSAAGDWAFYGGDAGGSRYSQLDQINKANVAELKPAWELHTGDVSDGSDGRPKSEFEATPIVVAGTMFLTTPFNRVLAIDPETGQQKWSFDPKIDLHVHYSEGLVNRGVAYWSDSAGGGDDTCGQRIFLATIDARLFAQYQSARRIRGNLGAGRHRRSRDRRLLDRRQRSGQ
jgi:quinoprotein glucose dehydrogenase